MARKPATKATRKGAAVDPDAAGALPIPVEAADPPALPLLPGTRRACVVGAGLGGLALAIRLQAGGVQTVVVEARDKPGGCAYFTERDGFIFDGGPTAFIDPGALSDLWAISGHIMGEDVELLPVAPHVRLNWPDGSQFDLSADDAALTREIARIAPDDLAGYDDFLRWCAAAWHDDRARLERDAKVDLPALARALPALLRHQAWRPLHSLLSGFVESDKLREALGFTAILGGGNPLNVSAMHGLVHKLLRDGGLWWPRGGAHKLVDAMVAQFTRLGGTLRLHDPVVQIHTIGNRASEVETQSGWRERFDAVASNADIVHTYRELLSHSPTGPDMARRLMRKRFSPGMFIVHFGLAGSWPGIPHHMVLMGPRYTGLLEDIHQHGVLPQDQMIFLHHPTVTDPSVAPPGHSTFRAMIPVANLGKLPIDWEVVGPLLEKRVLDEVGRRLIPDIHDRIVVKSHYAPRDFALDLNAYLGSASSLEPSLTQSGWLRPGPRDPKMRNFYRVGAGTHPGAGVPGVLSSARSAAKLMLEDLK